ncbi:hypothetical protein HY29_13575 [Hyphomonas beringensis]|uniref:Uncharacterized protein n=1 Tax=Hyphomonas beringensis TaxID=1280946 RepID=A0A062UAI1_9PROT|nr:hypothetical protein HY29_13575 [Hyphomonas beringensis]
MQKRARACALADTPQAKRAVIGKMKGLTLRA